ncbi:MAG TPA: F0F1 ATP synthase subunit B [Chloroflexota bacterium]|nr:F0F1 ATP synthase subunit B [Chloroflexota bacterium]
MLGPVSISIPTLVVELLIFLVMVYVMETFVFGPIRRAWQERDRAIQEGLQSSTEGRDEAEQARQEVMRILAEGRRAAQELVDAATAEGGRQRDELVAQATAEFRRLVGAAQEEIRAERARSAEQLSRKIVDIALEAASAVSGQSYDRPQVRELAASIVGREGLA